MTQSASTWLRLSPGAAPAVATPTGLNIRGAAARCLLSPPDVKNASRSWAHIGADAEGRPKNLHRVATRVEKTAWVAAVDFVI